MIVKLQSEFKRAVEYGAGIRGQIGTGATFRHPEVDVEAEMNSAYGEFRELLVEKDFDFFLEETAQANLPTTRADGNENYSLVDWPLVAVLIKRVDVLVNNEWTSCEDIDWSQLRLPICGSTTARGIRPLYFSAKSFGTVAAATEAAGKIALAPFATPGKYKLSYLPRWVDITADGDKFIFPTETGFRWCVWNTIARISIRDEDPGKRYDKSVAERDRCEARIGRFSARTIATGGTRMRRSKNYNG